MAQSDGLSPDFAGRVKGQAFTTPWGITLTKLVNTNGTTAVSVFGSSVNSVNGFKGTFLGFSVIPSGDAVNGIITLKHSVSSGAATATVATVTKGGLFGSMSGSAFTGTGFTAAGTATLESNSAGNAAVILYFTASEPGA